MGQVAPIMKRISRVGRKIFENKKINTALGIFLALAAVFAGILSSPTSAFDNPKTTIAVLNLEDRAVVKTEPLQLKFPVEGGYISQGFWAYHPAIDIAAEIGTPVYSVSKGVVERVGFDFTGLGRTVVINHGLGFKSLYAHLKTMEVEVNQTVDEQTVIGYVGLTGRTNGPHLHLEFHENGRYLNPLDFLTLEPF